MDKIFAEGIYLNKVNDKAPAFILADVSIHVEKAMAWLRTLTPNEKGYINLTGKESKNGKRYFELNTWKPKSETKAPEYPEEELNPDNVPF